MKLRKCEPMRHPAHMNLLSVDIKHTPLDGYASGVVEFTVLLPTEYNITHNSLDSVIQEFLSELYGESINTYMRKQWLRKSQYVQFFMTNCPGTSVDEAVDKTWNLLKQSTIGGIGHYTFKLESWMSSSGSLVGESDHVQRAVARYSVN